MTHVLVEFAVGRHLEGVGEGDGELLLGLGACVHFVEDFVIIQGFDGGGFEEGFLEFELGWGEDPFH